MTVKDSPTLRQAATQILLLQEALADLRARIEPANPRNFALLADGPLDQIARLQAEIDDYVGATRVAEQRAPLWLTIRGEGIEWPDAPTSVLTNFIDAIRKGVQALAEIRITGALSTRPTSELKRACDFRVVALAPGSLRVGLELPEIPPTGVAASGDDEPAHAHAALGDYLTVATWAAGDEPVETLEGSIADATYRRHALRELERLVPRERGTVEAVELAGTLIGMGRSVRLTRATRPRLQAAATREVAVQPLEEVGDLREIDLDAQTFTLRDASRGVDIRCHFADELLDLAKDALGRRVRVNGHRETAGGRRGQLRPLEAVRIEVVEPDVGRG